MKKLKVILALMMVFVLLTSVNVFASFHSAGGGVGGGYALGMNNMTDTQITASTICWANGYGSVNVTIAYNGQILAQYAKIITQYETHLDVAVARPGETLIPSSSYTYHQADCNGGYWYTSLPLN